MTFDLKGIIVVITGGAGLLGQKHAEAVAELGGIPVIADIDENTAQDVAAEIEKAYHCPAFGVGVDITSIDDVEDLSHVVIQKFGHVDVLINNAANNPKMNALSADASSRLENFSLEHWEKDLAVGLTGSFLCSQVIGGRMAERGRGVIINISSDLGIIAPDQRLYQKEGVAPEQQSVKPVTYSVIKHGIIGLTKYLATYWSNNGVRVNALCPGGVRTDQSPEFVAEISKRIPMGRMARQDEYKGAIQFLCSDASSYMTGQALIVDGGRTCW